MKSLHFFAALVLLLLLQLPNALNAQVLEQTECGTLELNSQILPANMAYVGTTNTCQDETVIYNGARISAFKYTLIQVLANGTEIIIDEKNSDAGTITYTNLDEGRYYARIQATTYSTTRAANAFCTIIGFGAGTPNNYSTNEEIVGAPEPQIDLQETYCCGDDVILNTAGTRGVDGYVITICHKSSPSSSECINWKGTGWITGDVPSEVDLLDIWSNNGTSSWIFWTNNYYEVMLAVYNECDDWVSVTKTFFMGRPTPEFSIRDANNVTVSENGAICAGALPPVMDASESSCGSAYLVMICQFESNSPENCLNWRSTGWIEGDVSEVGDIDLLDVWRGGNPNSSWNFWSGFNYRVTLVLKAPCDYWESKSLTFNVLGDCFHGGGIGSGERSAATEANAENTKLYPTLVEAGIDFLKVEVANTNTQLSIYDLQGRTILQERLPEGYSQVAIDALQNGIYFGVITGEEGLISKTKIVVTR